MTLLALFGFVAICLLAIYMTFGFVATAIGEAIFGGVSSLTLILGLATALLWVLAWWLFPFNITFKVT